MGAKGLKGIETSKKPIQTAKRSKREVAVFAGGDGVHLSVPEKDTHVPQDLPQKKKGEGPVGWTGSKKKKSSAMVAQVQGSEFFSQE